MARKLTAEEHALMEMVRDQLTPLIPPAQRGSASGLASALVRMQDYFVSEEELTKLLQKYELNDEQTRDKICNEVLEWYDQDNCYGIPDEVIEKAINVVAQQAQDAGAAEEPDAPEAQPDGNNAQAGDADELQGGASGDVSQETVADDGSASGERAEGAEDARQGNALQVDADARPESEPLTSDDTTTAEASLEVYAGEEAAPSSEGAADATDEQQPLDTASAASTADSDGPHQPKFGKKAQSGQKDQPSKSDQPAKKSKNGQKNQADKHKKPGKKGQTGQKAKPEAQAKPDAQSESEQAAGAKAESVSTQTDEQSHSEKQARPKKQSQAKKQPKPQKQVQPGDESQPAAQTGQGGDSADSAPVDVPQKPSRSRDLRKIPYVRRGGLTDTEVREKIVQLDQRFWMNGWLLSHPQAYLLFEHELVTMNDILQDGMLPDDISRRQLAYQMGGDEKFFEYNSDGYRLLRALGMEDIIRHRPVPKPDLVYYAPRRRKHMRVLVTENLDPYLDVHDLMYEDGRTTILGQRIHAVVLGGGMPIVERNRLALLLDTLRADSIEVLYWGDIDRAGIDIMNRLDAELDPKYHFKPFSPAYELMVQKASERYPDARDNEPTTQVNMEGYDVEPLCSTLSDDAAAYVRTVIDACELIPQEILTKRDL
ncbi:MAG: Wadjet anti-phage system protein JetD domain-containing protein [Atopobiaceae bacterium]